MWQLAPTENINTLYWEPPVKPLIYIFIILYYIDQWVKPPIGYLNIFLTLFQHRKENCWSLFIVSLNDSNLNIHLMCILICIWLYIMIYCIIWYSWYVMIYNLVHMICYTCYVMMLYDMKIYWIIWYTWCVIIYHLVHMICYNIIWYEDILDIMTCMQMFRLLSFDYLTLSLDR